MTAACKECGAPTQWDDDAGSAICTNCATLVDPSQTVLADDPYLSLISPSASIVLKSFRSHGHSLAGQATKESRDTRNHHAMADFINSLALSINASGLSPRATVIFTQAMTAGSFRWGRKAKLVAAASLVLALREYRRPDSLNDIAYLLDVQSPSLVRILTAVISLLNLPFTPVDPSLHIPSLLAHLSSLISPHPISAPQLPAPLVSQLRLINLRSAANTATNLSTLLARLGPDYPLNSLPSPPTAVALFLLAIEAESRSPISQLGELAQALGSSCHKTSRVVVMNRYKLVQDEIGTMIDQVPWLQKYEQNNNNGRKRAKIGKRSVVARGIPDVLQFQDEIWRGTLKPVVVLDMDDEDTLPEDTDPNHLIPALQTRLAPILNPDRPPKRRKVAHHPLRDATQFLLNPLSGPLPDCESPPQPIHHPPIHTQRTISLPQQQSQTQFTSPTYSPPPLQSNAAHYPAHQVVQPLRITAHPSPASPPPPSVALPAPPRSGPSASRPSLPSYILTAPCTSVLRSNILPTRLQLLVASRGTADAIEDEELFGSGEMEGLIRSKEEAEDTWRRLVGLGILGKEDEEAGDESKEVGLDRRKRGEGGRKMKAGREREAEHTRKSRVDLDAFARFFEDTSAVENDKDEDMGVYDTALLGLEQFDDKDEDEECGGSSDVEGESGLLGRGLWNAARAMRRTTGMPKGREVVEGDELVVDEWRPMSPEAGVGYVYGDAGYEEEYD